MTRLKVEQTDLNVHQKIRHMFKNYGAMMAGISAETIGQNQAEISIGAVSKLGDLRTNIEQVVRNSGVAEPTNSCGQASNEICQLILGIEGAIEFEGLDYNLLSEDGANLKGSLPDKNLLVRVEVDRCNLPRTYIKVKREDFDPMEAAKNTVYLLEDQFLYLNIDREIIDFEQSSDKCKQLFDTIQSPHYQNYFLNDPILEEVLNDSDLQEILKEEGAWGEEELAVCEIGQIFRAKEKSLDVWKSSHSFTIFVPQTEDDAPRTLYPYQAYFGVHTMQNWFEDGKDETLSQLGIDLYIEKLVLLDKTMDTKERSSIYAELFSPPGKENTFCTNLNEKTDQLRVKFKVIEVNPEVALQNLTKIQEFIDINYPGKDIKSQCETYKRIAQQAMTEQLEKLLMQPNQKQVSYNIEKNQNTVKTLESTDTVREKFLSFKEKNNENKNVIEINDEAPKLNG